MGKRIDLTARVDEAMVSAPTGWDPEIARAVMERRRQRLQALADRSIENPSSGTEVIQLRLAEARANQEAEQVVEASLDLTADSTGKNAT